GLPPSVPCWQPLWPRVVAPDCQFLRVDQDKDKDCQLACSGSSQKPLCASDGRTFLSRCEFQRAKCKDPQLEIAHRGNCRGEAGRLRPRVLSSSLLTF
uniref:Kazal-like domain-containing protein n=1 Tax=Suricata suricatta TaxID=37032 RepID=A0A673U2Y7_SURSU